MGRASRIPFQGQPVQILFSSGFATLADVADLDGDGLDQVG